MKLFKTIAAVALFAFSTLAMAQAPQGGQRQGMGSSSDRAKRTADQISEAVGLSAEQKAKVLELSLKNAKADSLRMVEMRNQGGNGQNMDFEAMRAENQKRNEARNAEFKALMNDAQKAKYDEYLKSRPQRGGFGGGQGGQGGGNR
jgi:periplasmic protein CpxP/Spy